MRSFATILEALSHHAAATPEKVVYTWVDVNCKEQRKMTFKQLEDEANAVAAKLLKLKCKKGDRVMVAYPFGLEFLAGMFGAMKIGVIPCSIYPPNPNQLKTEIPKFRGFVEDAGAKYALTTNTFAAAMTATSVLYRSGVTWIGTDKPTVKKSRFGQTKAYENYVGEPNDICFIQYTSGSTGRPKGVMISHQNLAENCRAIATMSGTTDANLASTVAALWVPQYHDMGLVAGFMTSLYGGIHLVMASPLDFVARPLLWTDMIEGYQANLTCGPNFAYALLLKRLQQANRKANWSCVRRAMFGGEPAQSHVVEATAETLSIKPENIYNIYGMAESVVFLTGGSAYPDSEGLVQCGEVDSHTVKLRIVQDGREVEDGQVGSIWAQSPRVAAGYYGQEELSTSTFLNGLAGYDGTWLDSGDLGKIVNGQLYVTGRVKDVIIVNGKNYYPTDVELSIDDAFGHVIRPGRTAAFQHGEDSIGITTEGRKDFNKSENEDLAVKIANHVSQMHGLFVSEVVVLKLGVTPKTTSGKLKRKEIRQTTIDGDWKDSSIFFQLKKQELTTIAPEKELSSFLERSFSMRGVASGEFYLEEPTQREIIRQSMRQLNLGDITTSDDESVCSSNMEQPHVAVIGGGAAGLITALRLAQRNIKVTLLERNDCIGGHARHVEVFGHLRNPAFGYFIGEQSPNLMKLAEELGIEPIKFSEAWQARSVVPMGKEPLPEVSRAQAGQFFADMQKIYKAGTGQDETLGQYLEKNGYDEHFIVHFYVGRIVSFFAGQTIQDYLNVPLNLVAWFVVALFTTSNDILRLCNKDYMEAFLVQLEQLGVDVRTSVSPRIVSRDDSGVIIEIGQNSSEMLKVDKLVLAVPPNAAVNILGDLRSNEEHVLVDFECPLETVVLHTDPKWADPNMPNGVFANIPDCSTSMPTHHDTIPLTSSIVSDTDNKTLVYSTHAYATHEELSFDSPTERMSFTHTKMTTDALCLRKSLLKQQGKNSTYYAGGWTRGFMLHEDALVSGILVANELLRDYGLKKHAVLERATAIPLGPRVQEKPVGPCSQLETFSSRYDKAIASVFGNEIDSSKTWSENGLTSLRSAELRSTVEEVLHVVLPSNFEQLYPTPKALQIFLEEAEGKSFPVVEQYTHRDFQWGTKRSRLGKVQLGVLQSLLSVVIVLLLLSAMVPAGLLVFWVMDHCPSTGVCQGLESWLVLPLAFPLFMLSFSLITVGCKWLVVGKYRHQQIELLSWDYLQWWFVDRLMEIWETLVGPFYVETKYIWIFYWLLGADLAWSAKIESYIREFDLVQIGDHATIGHSIKCRKFSQSDEGHPKITFRPIVIGETCQVSGMVSPGVIIGNGSKVEKLAAVEEGAEVPDNTLARGTPAHNAGPSEEQEPNKNEESLLGAFKIAWTIFEIYHFFTISRVVHYILNLILPQWRYGSVLHWFLLFPSSALLALCTSIALKWLLIGKRDPSAGYGGCLGQKVANWACDFHFRIASWIQAPFFGQSKLWNVILILHGLDVDMMSLLSGGYFIFLPSKVDFVKIRRCFVPTCSLDFGNKAKSKIELISSSIGWASNIHAGVKFVRSTLPPRSDVNDNVYDLNQAGNTRKPTILELLFPEISQIIVNVALFASIIPAFEIGKVALSNGSTTVALMGLLSAVMVQLLVWILMTRVAETILFGLPKKFQLNLFGVYLNFVWYFGVLNYLAMLFHGTPMFGYYARMMGAQVDGDLWYFGNSLYEFGKLHFEGGTIVDDSHVSGHYIDSKGLTLRDTYVSGILHPGCYASAGCVVSGGEHGPWKSFVRSKDSSTLEGSSSTSDGVVKPGSTRTSVPEEQHDDGSIYDGSIHSV